MLAAGSETADRVVKAGLCSGCGLCASVAGGRMQVVAPGYNRPAPAEPVDPAVEAMIAASCPGSVVAPWHDAPILHPWWGPCHRVLTGHSTNAALRHRASSGGALTALLLFALETRRIDRVLEVTADPEKPTRNLVTVSRTASQVMEASGSRYAASSPLGRIMEMAEEGGRMAFVGKPCDVSAFRLLCGFDEKLRERVPLVLSFFCAGIPSERGVRNILREMRMSESQLEEFRYRGFGWPGLATAKARDGRIATMSYERSWGGYLSKDVQFRCKICPDAVGGVADIACGDAWYGGENGYPLFNEHKGRSLIITRTRAGDELLAAAVDAGYVAASSLPIEEVALMQPSQARRKSVVGARLTALRMSRRPRPTVKGLRLREAAALGSIHQRARNFLGTWWRILSGRQ